MLEQAHATLKGGAKAVEIKAEEAAAAAAKVETYHCRRLDDGDDPGRAAATRQGATAAMSSMQVTTIVT